MSITIGVLSWMPDLERFFAMAANLVKPGGALFIYEEHPIMRMVEPAAADAPIVWELSYFHRQPYVETAGLDYFSGESYQAKPGKAI